MAAAARARLEPSRPLLRHGLLVVDDPERPLLTRGPAGTRPGDGPPARRRRAGPAAGAADRDGAAVRHPAGRPADPGPRAGVAAGAHPGAHAGYRGRGRRRRPVRELAGTALVLDLRRLSRGPDPRIGGHGGRPRGPAARRRPGRRAGRDAGRVRARTRCTGWPRPAYRWCWSAPRPGIRSGRPRRRCSPTLRPWAAGSGWSSGTACCSRATRRSTTPWSPPTWRWVPARCSRRSGPPRRRPG